jgi:uncharacterized membrane protein YqjE
LAAEDHNSAAGIADAINQISERASNLVREEIELAKAEVTDKVTKLVKGAIVGGAAAIFAIFGLVLLLEGFAWLAWYLLHGGDTSDIFWGFFIVAGILFLLGGLAGFLAAKLFKSGAPPVPAMAIDEAKKTRRELT